MNRYYAIRCIDSDTIYGECYEYLVDAEWMIQDLAYKAGENESEYEIIEVLKYVKAKRA